MNLDNFKDAIMQLNTKRAKEIRCTTGTSKVSLLCCQGPSTPRGPTGSAAATQQSHGTADHQKQRTNLFK